MTKKKILEEDQNKKKEEKEEWENKYLRVLADYQNLEKRSLEEKREWAKISNKELLLRLLPVLDTLILASKHTEDQGLRVAIKHFLDVLKSEGVEKIEAEGKNFDPAIMECVHTEQGEENKVLEIVRDGYKMFDRVLRPVQVKVGRQLQKEENIL